MPVLVCIRVGEDDMKYDFLDMHKQKMWNDILLTYKKEPAAFASNVDFNILAEAFFHTGSYVESEEFINKSLMISSDNNWSRVIKFNIDVKQVNLTYALDELFSYLEKSSFESETLMRLFIDKSVEIDEFDRASIVNSKRDVIKKGTNSPYAIAIQCFNKADVLENVFKNLLNCTATVNFELVILQDMYLDSDAEKYSKGWSDVRNILKIYHPLLMEKFSSVTTIYNKENFGTAPSCRKLLNYTSKVYEGFIFLEDDCLLSKDALILTEEFLKNHINENAYWFATCESINFDAKKYNVSEEEMESILSKIENIEDLKSLYGELNFVPSTCFITKREIWNKVENIRAFIRGPESLSKFLVGMNKKTIFPLIPRASDIGMLHALGYSVKHLTLAGVKEFKNTYYLPDYNEESLTINLASKELVDKVYFISTKSVTDNF